MIVDVEPREDERGMFCRSWCAREFANAGLDHHLTQCNLSFNSYRGTLRGMHYQADPYPEAKLVRCERGAIYDVALDLRKASPTYLKWTSAELTSDNRRSLFVPAGCAHGFQVLEDNTEVFYQMSESYHPDLALGVRWDDPAFGISWPLENPLLSARDASYPDFQA